MRKASKTMLFGLDPRPYVWHRKSDFICGADWAAQVTVECEVPYDPALAGLPLLPGDWLIWRGDVRRLEGLTNEDFRRTYTPMGSWRG